MFGDLVKEINLKKYFWAASAVFSFNMIFTWFAKRFWMEPLLFDSANIVLREKEEVALYWVWHVFGHLINATFVSFACISWEDGKGPYEGVKAGLVIAFIEASIIFIINPYVPVPTISLWLFVANIFFLSGMGGFISTKLYRMKF